jgi:hypothetical protein
MIDDMTARRLKENRMSRSEEARRLGSLSAIVRLIEADFASK